MIYRPAAGVIFFGIYSTALPKYKGKWLYDGVGGWGLAKPRYLSCQSLEFGGLKALWVWSQKSAKSGDFAWFSPL